MATAEQEYAAWWARAQARQPHRGAAPLRMRACRDPRIFPAREGRERALITPSRCRCRRARGTKSRRRSPQAGRLRGAAHGGPINGTRTVLREGGLAGLGSGAAAAATPMAAMCTRVCRTPLPTDRRRRTMGTGVAKDTPGTMDTLRGHPTASSRLQRQLPTGLMGTGLTAMLRAGSRVSARRDGFYCQPRLVETETERSGVRASGPCTLLEFILIGT